MRLPKMPKGDGGFTLVELLVVILIIVILSVTMLPLLKPFVTKAQYTAEGVPVIGNLRTKVEIFRIEKDYLPGVPVDPSTAKPFLLSGTAGATTNGFSFSDLVTVAFPSMFTAANCIQYMTVGTNSSDKTSYQFFSGNTALNDLEGNLTPGTGKLSDHVYKKIDINYSDLTGKRLRPHHLKYAVVGNMGETYLWVVACFGNGDGLSAGCGYAVAEYNDVVNQRKFVATFERYKPLSESQLTFDISNMNPTATYCEDNPNSVWLPTFENLVGTADTASTYAGLVEAMKLAGWEF